MKNFLTVMLSVLIIIGGIYSFPPVLSKAAPPSSSFSVKDRESFTEVTLSVEQNSDIADVLNSAFALAKQYATDKKPYHILVPRGTYQLSHTVNIFSNTNLYLDGVCLKRCFSSGSMLKCGSQKYTTFGYEGYRNISIEGGTFDGNCALGPYAYSSNPFTNLRFAHAKNVTLNGVTICNNVGGHHLEIGGVNGAIITNCTFYGYKDPINATENTEKEAIQIDIMHSEDIFYGYPAYDDTPCTNITISDCKFQNLSRGIGTHSAVVGTYYNGIIIANNTFTDIRDQAILASSFKNSTIADNTMKRVGSGIHFRYMTFSTAGFYLPNQSSPIIYLDPMANTSIINNTIITSPHGYGTSADESRGIYVQGRKVNNGIFDGDYQISHLIIQNNTIQTEGNGIRLVNVYDSTVTNNTISISSTEKDIKPISTKECQNNKIQFNDIKIINKLKTN